MEILYILIPLSIILIGIAIKVFIWAVKNDQFEDLDGPAHRILYDDDKDMIPPEARPEKDKGSESAAEQEKER